MHKGQDQVCTVEVVYISYNIEIPNKSANYQIKVQTRSLNTSQLCKSFNIRLDILDKVNYFVDIKVTKSWWHRG